MPVTVAVAPGPLFHLGTVTLAGPVPDEARAKFALAPGQPARAADVLAAGDRLLTALRDQGYALAKVAPPVATLRTATETLDVSFAVAAGPRVDLGPVTVSGLQRMNPAFVDRRLLVHQGEPFSPEKIEAARADLAALGVFGSVRAVPATTLDAEGRLPLGFVVTERPLHLVTADASYSTDLGLGLSAGWHHRNLFGNAEQLNLTAGVNLGGSAQRKPGYNAAAQFIKPDFWARDQTLQVDLGAVDQYLQAYDRRAVTADALLARKLSPHWTATAGLSGEQARITQEGVTQNYTLLAVPLGLRYDDTDNLFNPTRGIRAAATATPTQSLAGKPGTFVLAQLAGSTYLDASALWGAPGRSVVALRGLVGRAFGVSQFGLPPDQRFYAGGSGTVRGYRYQTVGPLFPDDTPEGGTAVSAGTIELRQRILDNYGAVAFVDAGQVNANGAPFGGQTRVGAGIGARYYTAIGPIRLDFAVPLDKPPGGDSFEVYIGIGQAF